MHAFDRYLLVPFVHEVVWLNDRRYKRIGRTGADEAATVRAQLIEPELDDRDSFRSIRCIVSEGKIKLDIGSGAEIPRVDEAVHDCWTDGAHARTPQGPFGRLADNREPVHVARFDSLYANDHVDHIVVLQARPDAGQFMNDRKPELRKQRRRTHTGQLEELRRIGGPGAENHFAASCYVPMRM